MRPARMVSLLFIMCLMGWGCGDSEDELPLDKNASVVFDIDGTLTTGPGVLDFFTPRPHAARAVASYVDKGYLVVYLTTRPWFLRDITEAWLSEKGFPDLPLYMADEILIDAPERTVAYKLQTLLALSRHEKRTFLYGYGDSTTDFEAYNLTGIPVRQTFALLRRGEPTCQIGSYESCLPGYTDHLEYIQDQPNP